MTFLQPGLLWALPLALLPLLIHLLNRMRFRTVRWAAIEFLLRANRASTRHAKLRQFLILACRVLALAALGLMLARPLAGGWMGMAFSGAPDVVIILLDRSASMETIDAGTRETRRERALQLLARAGEGLRGRSRFVLIDNALLKPQELTSVALLPKMSIVAPTDTAADVPVLLDAAGDWLQSFKPGRAEIWIASDLQSSNWRPDDDRWNAGIARVQSHPAGARVRLLAFTASSLENRSIEVTDVQRRSHAGNTEALVTIGLRRGESNKATLPISALFQTNRSGFEVEIQGQSLQFRHPLPLNEKSTAPWGKFDLPADPNLRDNVAYFLAPDSTRRLVAVVASEEALPRKILPLAAAPAPEQLGQSAELIEHPTSAAWERYALVIWQDALPKGSVAEALRNYVRSGGVVVFFPPLKEKGEGFEGISWGEADTSENGLQVTQWDHRDGPLSDSEDGAPLPVDSLKIAWRMKITGERTPLAMFADGETFLGRRTIGKGSIWFCATLPDHNWSDLSSGPVLVPMLLRMAALGGARHFQSSALTPGAAVVAADPQRWVRLEPESPGDVRVDAGIYRNGETIVAINRPALEDEPEVLQPDAARALFQKLPTQWFEEKAGAAAELQTEIWRPLLMLMLFLLLAEAALILPARPIVIAEAGHTRKPARPNPDLAKAA